MPWDKYLIPICAKSDFQDGGLVQEIADLGDCHSAVPHSALLREANMLFIDGPKDGIFEDRFLRHLATIQLRPRTLLEFDDIRVWSMLGIWRRIPQPKLNITIFGHWTGTGLVEWQ